MSVPPKKLWIILPLAGFVILLFLLGRRGQPGEGEGETTGSQMADRETGPERFVPIPEKGGEDRHDVPLPENARDVIPGEFTVGFKDAGSMEAFIDAAGANGLEILAVIPELMTVRVAGPRSAMEALLTDEMTVDYNYRVIVPAFPDLGFWQSENLSPFGNDILTFLGAPAPGDLIGWGSGVTVAVLDTGWQGHEDIPADAVRRISLLDRSESGEFSGHGTAVTGLILSTNPFAPGLAPGSEILAIQVLNGKGQGDAFTLASGILAAVQNGASVINMSLGTYGNSEVLREAVRYASERGIVMVAASGNDGQSVVTYPAAYPEVIGVAAVDADGNRAPFSNFGDGVDLAAPGFKVHALWEEDGFIYFDGTSASAPMVSAIAARIIESGVADSPDEIRRLILASANEAGFPGDDLQYGAGILNIERIENAGKSGIVDIALAGLYPAVELSKGGTFPLYVSLENRGTEFISGTTVELTINGEPYFYSFSGMEAGGVDSIQIPVQEDRLLSGTPYTVEAEAKLPGKLQDIHPDNNRREITLSRNPGE